MPFYNYELDKKGIAALISDCHRLLGRDATLRLLDDLKDLGFKAATRAGLSFSKDDMRVPDTKEKIIDRTQKEIEKVEKAFGKGVITEGERYLKIIDMWTHAREQLGNDLIRVLREDVRENDPYVNPIYCMVASGARGSIDQIRQLAGMRGLMAKPSGEIIETPIKANFREGLRVLEAAASRFGIALEIDRFDFASWNYYERHGSMLPDDWKEQIGGHDDGHRAAIPGVEDRADQQDDRDGHNGDNERVERDLRQDREVGTAFDALVQPLAEAADAVGLPEDLGDEGDGEAPVGPRRGRHPDSPRNSRTRFWKW